MCRYAAVEDRLNDAELATMVDTLKKASGLKEGAVSSVEAVYQLKSAVEMSSTTDLNSTGGKRAVAVGRRVQPR